MVQSRYDRAFMNNADKSFYYEYLLASGSGAFASSTIAGCNTRKYHSLLTVLQPQMDGNDHVIVSSLDEVLTHNGERHELGTHQYPGAVHPRGYELVEEFTLSPVPRWTYNAGKCVLSKEMLMPDQEDALLIKYTIEKATGPVNLRLSPFMAFRHSHGINKVNDSANWRINEVTNGFNVRLYEGYQPAYIQASMKCTVEANPEWYYNIEYPIELSRGHDYHEDQLVPGSLVVELKQGDKLIVCLGMSECQPKMLPMRYANALKKKPELNSTQDILQHAAKQFIVKRGEAIMIKAGYHWFGYWGRDKFISLPGLFLHTGRSKDYKKVLDASLPDLKNGLFPNCGIGEHAIYNTVDSSLWFVWAVQQYGQHVKDHKKMWRDYGPACKEILKYYRDGTMFNIHMAGDGLISAGQDGYSLTWMDAVVEGYTVTPRRGKPVEINALWYNAICYCIEAAKEAKDDAFIAEWTKMREKVKSSFVAAYWNDERQYLADVINENGAADWAVRPNQVFALSLPYSPVPDVLWPNILTTVRQNLLTHKGLKTLAADDPDYKATYGGDQYVRDSAYHQGTIWPWLLGHYAEACVRTYGKDARQELKMIYADLEKMLGDLCLFSIPEIYSAEPPHAAAGAAAQAWSVAEALRIQAMLNALND